MDAKEGMIVAFAHGSKEFTMRYDAPKKDIKHEELLARIHGLISLATIRLYLIK